MPSARGPCPSTIPPRRAAICANASSQEIASNPEPSWRRRMGCTMRSRSSNGIARRCVRGRHTARRRARMPHNRQLGHHATVLNACRKGAIGIASPACVTTARPSRFTADAISITPFISQTQQAKSPATSPRPKKPPARQRPAGGPTSNRRHLTPRTSWRR